MLLCVYNTNKRKRGAYMTQEKENVQRIAEFNALFLSLNEKGQEAALTVLQSLNFAQSVMYSQDTEKQCKPSKQLV